MYSLFFVAAHRRTDCTNDKKTQGYNSSPLGRTKKPLAIVMVARGFSCFLGNLGQKNTSVKNLTHSFTH